MKKVAFTIGLGLFAIGLFAQTPSNSLNTKPATASVTKTAPATQGTMHQSATSNAKTRQGTMANVGTTKPTQKPADKAMAKSATTAKSGNKVTEANKHKNKGQHKKPEGSSKEKTKSSGSPKQN